MSETKEAVQAFQREKSTGMLAGRNVFGDATPAFLSLGIPLEQPLPTGSEEDSGEAPPFELEEGDI